MSVPVASGLTYEDLAGFPQDDRLRRELIEGELYESPSPTIHHQLAVTAIAAALHSHAEEHGGLALLAPMDVVFSPENVVQPDVFYLSPERNAELAEERIIGVVPDLLVEVSSPDTRRLDLIKKRNLYEGEAVPEYWFVDLEADLIDVYRLDATGRYGEPQTFGEDDTLTCLAAPGFSLSVDEALARQERAGP